MHLPTGVVYVRLAKVSATFSKALPDNLKYIVGLGPWLYSTTELASCIDFFFEFDQEKSVNEGGFTTS